MPETLYRVAWTVRSTGFSGHGSPLPLPLAEAWKDYGDKKYSGEVDHWVEPVKTT